jgi:hypothetical protein
MTTAGFELASLQESTLALSPTSCTYLYFEGGKGIVTSYYDLAGEWEEQAEVFLLNVGSSLQDFMVLEPRRQQFECFEYFLAIRL